MQNNTDITREELYSLLMESIKNSEQKLANNKNISRVKYTTCKAYTVTGFESRPLFNWGIAAGLWTFALLILIIAKLRKKIHPIKTAIHYYHKK